MEINSKNVTSQPRPNTAEQPIQTSFKKKKKKRLTIIFAMYKMTFKLKETWK